MAGAGVIGLAVARRIAMTGREVLVLDAAESFGTETSSRNSEVIHAGIYYPPGSLKARFCIAGREALYRYAGERGIPHRRTGKLVVAADMGQIARLETIVARARACGLDELEIIEGKRAIGMEPALRCVAALISPMTGIVDSHAFMQSLIGDVEARGGMVVFNTRVVSGALGADSVTLRTRNALDGDDFEIETRLFVNAAGLAAHRLVASLEGFPAAFVPEMKFAKGNYFSTAARNPFTHLIYPVPVEGGLGVHLTFDLGGQLRFGPDVEWIDNFDYSVDPARSQAFYSEIRRYWPGLPDGSLNPAYCGIRTKVALNGKETGDFRIDGPSDHGCGPLINLFGIESPGLTSSLAIADFVVETHVGA